MKSAIKVLNKELKSALTVEEVFFFKNNIIFPSNKKLMKKFREMEAGEGWFGNYYIIKTNSYGIAFLIEDERIDEFDDWIERHKFLIKPLLNTFFLGDLYCETLNLIEKIEDVSDIKEIYGKIIHGMADVFNFDVGGIGEYDRSSNMVVGRGPGYNVSEEHVKAFQFHLDSDRVSYNSYINKDVFCTNDVDKVPGINKKFAKLFKVKKLCIIPLYVKDKLFGFIYGVRYESSPDFEEKEIELMSFTADRIARHVRELRLREQFKIRSEILFDLDELSGILAREVNLDKVFKMIADSAMALFDATGVSMLLYEKEKKELICQEKSGIDDCLIEIDEVKDKFISFLREGEKLYFFRDFYEEFDLKRGELKDRENISLISVPIYRENLPYGLLNIYLSEPQLFTEDVYDLIHPLAVQASVAIRNAELYSRAVQTTESIIKALSELESEKDLYTLNHSERVAMLSVEIAKKKGISDKNYLNDIERAALLHDVGKITIERMTLQKPTSLTRNEIKEIKLHPVVGANILSKIKGMEDISKYVLYHHERWDGEGYPDGLKGEEIPLFSRIISIADSIEAMLSDRPYRDGLDIEEVKSELKKESGKQFDPELVPIAIEIIDSESYQE